MPTDASNSVVGEAPDAADRTSGNMGTIKLFLIVNAMQFSYTGLYGCSKELVGNRDVDLVQYSFVRFSLIFVATCVTIWRNSEAGFDILRLPADSNLTAPLNGESPPPYKSLLTVNVMSGFIRNLLVAFGVSVIPLTLNFVIQGTLPFVIALLGLCLSGETVGKSEVLAMVFSFIGLCLIFLADSTQEKDEEKEAGKRSTLMGLLACIFSVFLLACLSLSTRRLKKVNYLTIMFWFNLVPTVSLGLYVLTLSLFYGTPFLPNFDLEIGLLILSAAVLHMLAQSFLFRAN